MFDQKKYGFYYKCITKYIIIFKGTDITLIYITRKVLKRYKDVSNSTHSGTFQTHNHVQACFYRLHTYHVSDIRRTRLDIRLVPSDTLSAIRLVPSDTLSAIRLVPSDTLSAIRLVPSDTLSAIRLVPSDTLSAIRLIPSDTLSDIRLVPL